MLKPKQPRDESQVYALVAGFVIAHLRQERKLTQEELARAMGATQSTVSRIESGHAAPNQYELRAIASAFDIGNAELTQMIDDAFARTQKVAESVVPPSHSTTPWWENAVLVVGVIGLVGLVLFAVAYVLRKGKAEEDE